MVKIKRCDAKAGSTVNSYGCSNADPTLSKKNLSKRECPDDPSVHNLPSHPGLKGSRLRRSHLTIRLDFRNSSSS